MGVGWGGDEDISVVLVMDGVEIGEGRVETEMMCIHCAHNTVTSVCIHVASISRPSPSSRNIAP